MSQSNYKDAPPPYPGPPSWAPGTPGVHTYYGAPPTAAPYSPGPPQESYYGPPPPSQRYGATSTTVIVTPPDVVIIGACPACRVGVLEDDFTCLGILCAIAFFPIGILCCLASREKRCSNCGASFG